MITVKYYMKVHRGKRIRCAWVNVCDEMYVGCDAMPGNEEMSDLFNYVFAKIPGLYGWITGVFDNQYAISI